MSDALAYVVRVPNGHPLPIVLSAPHVGVEFPPELKKDFLPEIIARPPDTDWFVHELYEFASELGITMIFARYSRYVVDLNRPPDSAPLYSDGRRETGLLPLTTFDGAPLYANPAAEAKARSREEIARRIALYYEPYHRELARLLEAHRTRHRHAVVFDAHSIRPFVPSIQNEIFPDLILGDQDGKTAAPELIAAAESGLRASAFSVSHNHPFKGGHITRKSGNPRGGIHALQLEMSQAVYMNEAFTELDPAKLRRIRPVLREVFKRLQSALEALA